MNITVTHSNRYYYLKDHLGNIRVTVNEFGQAEAYNDYYPFGLQMPGRSVNNAMTDDIYKFGGKELDEESGLNWYYFGARYYDPAIGRWLSVDPLASSYPSWSPYNYSLNDPIGKRDPDGRFVWGAVIGAAVDIGLQVANNYATGQDLTKIDYGSVAISAAAGLASGGLSSLTKAYKAGKTIAAVGTAVISAGEGVAKSAASGQEITAKGVAMDALLGAGASKVGDAVDAKITKTIQNAGDTGVQAGKATQKLQGTRTNSKTSRATYRKNAANAANANAVADKAAKKANTVMTLENVGVSDAASATAGNTAGAIEEELKDQ
ncbi:MAG: RHS repeat-associated core domain-containing protein [Calditrichaceae bacterium]